MADVHGFCDERFRPLEDAFRRNLDSGLDKGASLAVTLGGESVVDLWGGTRDDEQATPWEADTIVRVFSTSKIALMLMVLMLVDRGLPRPRRADRHVLAGVREAWQGNDHHSPGAGPPVGLPGYGRSVTFDDLARLEQRASTILEEASALVRAGHDQLLPPTDLRRPAR